MRGSPIRKSSDQRSVDSSPRLIAASYVLHRLLVPRHPPCALNNLATQKHRTTSARKDTCRAGLQELQQSESKRCSRPLCSSQRTTRHPPHDPAEPDPPHRADGGTRCRQALTQEQRPRPPEAHAPPGRIRSLRTQQRAYEPVTTTRLRSTHTPRGMQYWEPATRAGRTGQRSTLEHHPTHSPAPGNGHRSRCERGSGPPDESGGQCSLERR